MSYITSCLPLRGCRSLCTLENCNTFPYISFTLHQQKTMLIVIQQRCMCINVCVRHVAMNFSAEKLYTPHKFLSGERFLIVVTAMRWQDTILQHHCKTWILLDSNTPQLRADSGTSGLSKQLTWVTCSLDSDFCKAVISVSTREILDK